MKFTKIGLLCAVFIFMGNAYADQPGYKACALMKTPEIRKTCIEIVKNSTRPYPCLLVEFLRKFEDDDQVLKVLSESSDYVYNRDALAACDFDYDNNAQELLKCLNDVGHKSVKYGVNRQRKRAVSEWILGQSTDNAVRDAQSRASCPKGAKLDWIKQYQGEEFICYTQQCVNGQCSQCSGEYTCTSKYKDFLEVQ